MKRRQNINKENQIQPTRWNRSSFAQINLKGDSITQDLKHTEKKKKTAEEKAKSKPLESTTKAATTTTTKAAVAKDIEPKGEPKKYKDDNWHLRKILLKIKISYSESHNSN